MAKPPNPPNRKGPAKLGSIQDAMKKLQGEISDASAASRAAARRLQDDAAAAREAAGRLQRAAQDVPGAVRSDADRARRALEEQLRAKARAKRRGEEPPSRSRTAAPPAGGLQGRIANILAQVA